MLCVAQIECYNVWVLFMGGRGAHKGLNNIRRSSNNFSIGRKHYRYFMDSAKNTNIKKKIM